MELATLEATMAFGRSLGALLNAGDVVMLNGPLGAGKTALAKGMLLGLGFDGDVPSPSFPLVIPYLPPEVRLPVWHVDLYRIEQTDDLIDLGLEDASGDGALIVEWPTLLPPNLYREGLNLNLEVHADDSRHLTAQVPPSWKDRWPPR